MKETLSKGKREKPKDKWSSKKELHMSFVFPLMPLEIVSLRGILVFLNTHPTPWFSYIRRRVGCPLLHPFLTYKCHA